MQFLVMFSTVAAGMMLIAGSVTVVSRAFQILSDEEKKAKYDRFGGDPDNRFGAGSASTSSPFSSFARSPSSGRGPMFEDEISPEELFNRFFGGGVGGGPFGASLSISESSPSETDYLFRRRWHVRQRPPICL